MHTGHLGNRKKVIEYLNMSQYDSFTVTPPRTNWEFTGETKEEYVKRHWEEIVAAIQFFDDSFVAAGCRSATKSPQTTDWTPLNIRNMYASTRENAQRTIDHALLLLNSHDTTPECYDEGLFRFLSELSNWADCCDKQT